MFDNVSKDLDKLVDALARMTPEEVCGVAQILGVALKDENGELWKAEEFLLKICTNFCERNRKQRRNLLKLIKITVDGRPLRAADNSADKE